MKTLSAIAILACLFLFSCKNSSNVTEQKTKTYQTIMVNSAKMPCEQGPDMMCYQVSSSADPVEWSPMANDIEGFRYTAGYVYTLKVEVLESNARGVNYRMVELLDQQVDMTQRISDIWVVREVNGRPLSEAALISRPTLELNTSKMAIMGQAPCNSFQSSIEELGDSELRFGPISSTRRACPELETEKDIFNAFRATRTYKMDSMLLHLFDERGTKVMLLKKGH